jgi:hypothetical protein
MAFCSNRVMETVSFVSCAGMGKSLFTRTLQHVNPPTLHHVRVRDGVDCDYIALIGKNNK